MNTTLLNPPNQWARRGDLEWNGAPAVRVFEHKLVDLRVLRSLSKTRDGSMWIHVSVSRPDRIPNWAELSKVKDEFIGVNREAYQVLAAKKDHVNVMEFCLHLWAPVDGVRRVANLHDLVEEVAQ